MLDLTVTFGAKAYESLHAEVSTFNGAGIDTRESSNAVIAAFWTRILANVQRDGDSIKSTAQFTPAELRTVASDVMIHMLAGSGSGAGEMAFAAAYIMKQISPRCAGEIAPLQARMALKGE